MNAFLIEHIRYFHIQLLYSLSLVLTQKGEKLRTTSILNK